MIKDYLDPDSVINKGFFESIKEIVICNICSGILAIPKECITCQNSFCKKCLDEWTCLNDSCPYKCEKSEFRESSRTLKNLLEKLIFKCLFCDSVERDGSYFNHLMHLKNCDKIRVNCPTCDSLVIKKKLNENKSYLKLKENYTILSEKYKILKEENQKLKESINYVKELQNDTQINNNSNQLNSLLIKNNKENSSSESGELGIIDKCDHFKGNYMPIFSCCEKSYPCYICHNKYKDHEYKISNKVVCLICKNIYSGPKCNVCNTYQIYRKK